MENLLRQQLIDEQLLERIRKDDYAAFTQLYTKYKHPLLHFTFRYTRDSYFSEDIIQEFFIQLWVKRNEIRIQRSVASYLFRSVRNRILNHFRDRETYRKYFSHSEMPEIYADDDIQRAIEFSELEKRVIHLIAVMPKKYKDPYIFTVRNQLPVRKTASLLGRPINTVDKQIRKAVSFMRGHLKNKEYSLK